MIQSRMIVNEAVIFIIKLLLIVIGDLLNSGQSLKEIAEKTLLKFKGMERPQGNMMEKYYSSITTVKK